MRLAALVIFILIGATMWGLAIGRIIQGEPWNEPVLFAALGTSGLALVLADERRRHQRRCRQSRQP